MTTTGPALATRDLACGIGRRTVLTGIDLEVRRGEVLGLIGANGTGKSTLLRVLAGVRAPTAGEVRLGDEPLASYSARDRARRIAFVAQEEAAPSDLLVGELVALGRLPHARSWGGVDDTSRTAVDEALRLVGLERAARVPLDQLSGGERRRAVLARGLAQQAPLLLLDEPTNHLDIRHQLAVMRLVRRLSREHGRAVVLALHDLDLAATFCDRIAVLHDGTLLACGTPDDVLTPDVLHDAFGVLATRVTHPLTGRTHLLFSHDERETHP
ncbi:iron complex transport system ATP-binding protein [Nocardioides aromaticivorans]|uniref:Iron complex transport system ATP-binding protein n=1 Tax=Nocardioides aromaticivorans TaxID=200618 RepID=A0A7Y9ZFX0_9ACTN|nr:ABC transporter ATP-binding protein [Nocardioides aromaticivorans]NYI44707.1 iron complex transport system ATP-binding protein [Nocardioides aromaticivorans]